jgi:hypothetical protein
VADSKLKAIAEYDGRRLESGLVQSQKAVSQAAQNVEGRFLKLGNVLKDFRREQVAQGRQARFLADEIASIVPGADAAGSSMRGLLGVFVEATAGGLSFGLAFEALKLGMEAVGRAAKEAAEFQKMLSDAHAKATDSLNEYVVASQQMTEGQRLGAQATKELTAEQSKRISEVNKLGAALAAERSEEMQILLLEAGAGTQNAYAIRQLEDKTSKLWAQVDAIRAEAAAIRDVASAYADEAAESKQAEFAKRALENISDKEAEKEKERAKKRKEMLKELAEDDAKRSDERREARKRAMAEQDISATAILLGPRESIKAPPQREASAAELMKENGPELESAADRAKRLAKSLDEAKAKSMALAQSISGPLGNALSGMLLHGKSFTEQMQAFFTQMAEMFIQKVAEMIAQWLVFKAITAFFGGPVGFVSPSPSVALATGAWSIPYDGFPATLHRGEMVVPFGPAEDLRQGRSGVTVNFNLSAAYMDRRGIAQFFHDNQGHILRTLSSVAGNRRG